MSDVPAAKATYRVDWPRFIGGIALGYMTSSFLHLLFQSFWLDIITLGVAMTAMMTVAFLLGEWDAQRDRIRANVERRQHPEPDPLEIDEDRAPGDKRDTLHRLSKREEPPSA